MRRRHRVYQKVIADNAVDNNFKNKTTGTSPGLAHLLLSRRRGMDSPRFTIADLKDSESGRKFRVQGKWLDKQVELLAADSVDTWTTVVPLNESSFGENLSRLSLSLNDYVDTMKGALTGSNGAYQVSFSQGTLVWSKDLGEDITVDYGKVTFSRVNSTETDSVIYSLLGSYKETLSELDNARTLVQVVSEEHSRLLSAFEECTRVKNEMEKDLYAKFAAVLNEKKKYITKILGNKNDSNNIEPVPGPSNRR